MDEVSNHNKNKDKAIVPVIYYEIMRLRLEGHTYDSIAHRTNYSVGHITKLFYKKGLLYDLWQEYKENEIKERTELARQIFAANIDKVCRRMITIATSSTNDQAAISASKEVLDRALGKVKEQIDVQAIVGVMNMADFIKGAYESKDNQDVAKKPD